MGVLLPHNRRGLPFHNVHTCGAQPDATSDATANATANATPDTTTNPRRSPFRPTPATPATTGFNCNVGTYAMWPAVKQSWCCSNHHLCGQVTAPPPPADPYNCA